MARFRKDLAGIVSPDLRSGYYFKTNRVLDVWNEILSLYNARAMTDPNDKFPALSGLAAQFQRLLFKTPYLAGLWYKFMSRGLLWKGWGGHRRRELGDAKNCIRRSPVYRAPTWSWASIDRAIYPANPWAGEPTLEVVSCEVTLANNSLPFEKVIGGTLIAEGYVRETVCRPSPIRDSEIQVGRVRLDVKPDYLGE